MPLFTTSCTTSDWMHEPLDRTDPSRRRYVSEEASREDRTARMLEEMGVTPRDRAIAS